MTCLSVHVFAQQAEKDDENDRSSFFASLQKFSEKPFSEEKEAYRIMIWPTFHSPVLIRIDRNNEGIFVIAKKLGGEGGYEVRGIETEKQSKITEQHFLRFKKRLAESGFSTMVSRDTRFEKGDDGSIEICLDGSTWVLEQVLDGKYHYVERYCAEDPDLHKVGFELVNLSKLKIPKKELF